MFKVIQKTIEAIRDNQAHQANNFHVVSNQSPTASKPLSREWKNIEILREVKQGNFSNAKAFSGFGGLASALRNIEVQQALAQILSETELNSLQKSVSSDYFTPPNIVKYCWQIATQLGFTGGKILEPACAVGAFLEYMPKAIADNSTITGLELDKITAQIAQNLYPDVNVIEFDYTAYNDQGYDLIISNPPFSKTSTNDRIYPDLNGLKLHHIFLARSIRLLREGGLCIFVVPSYCLDSPTNHPRDIIAKEAELVFSARLPDNTFTGATVTTDVICFQKKAKPKNHHLDLTKIQLACGYRDVLSTYYIAHQSHILGNLEKYEFLLRKENRMRRGLKVVGTMAEVDRRLPQLIAELKPCYESLPPQGDNVINMQPNADSITEQLMKITNNLESVIVELKTLIQSQKAA